MSARSGIDRRDFLIILGASLVASCTDGARTAEGSTTAVSMIDPVSGLALAKSIIPGFGEEDYRVLDAVFAKSVPDQDVRLCASGLSALDEACEKSFGASFVRLDPNLKRQIAAWLDMDVNAPPKADDPADRAAACRFFELFKSIVLFVVFTSERSSETLVNYDPAPGTFGTYSEAGGAFRVDVYDRGSVFFFPAPRWRLA